MAVCDYGKCTKKLYTNLTNLHGTMTLVNSKFYTEKSPEILLVNNQNGNK